MRFEICRAVVGDRQAEHSRPRYCAGDAVPAAGRLFWMPWFDGARRFGPVSHRHRSRTPMHFGAVPRRIHVLPPGCRRRLLLSPGRAGDGGRFFPWGRLMPVLHCAIGEGIQVGDAIRIHLTGRIDDRLYLSMEAAWGRSLEVVSGFHATAPCDFGWNAYVFELRDGDGFRIGAVSVRIEDLRESASPARPLRDVRLHIDAPYPMTPVHIPRVRPVRPRLKAG